MAALTKIEKVRRKLRQILPTWMRDQGRAPTLDEFLTEYRLREQLHSSEYSKAKRVVMEELGYAGGDNNFQQLSKRVTMKEANAAAESRLQKELMRAAKHILPVMEKGRLEEVTVVFEDGEARLEFQQAPPPRQKLEL
jgi:predicted metal-dependent RNase